MKMQTSEKRGKPNVRRSNIVKRVLENWSDLHNEYGSNSLKIS